MSIDDPTVVDAIALDRDDGAVVLTIADTRAWTDVAAHLVVLEAKLRAYVGFVRRGELVAQHPRARDRPVRIDILFGAAPPERGVEFLERAKEILDEGEMELRWRVLGAR